jgi:putative transposase
VLDDYSRHILAWILTPTMAATDVQETLEPALPPASLVQVRVSSSPRLLTDNGPRHVSGKLRRRLEGRQTEDTRNVPYHAMTQGKVARYHRSMKNPVRPQTFQYPWDLEQKIGRFADNCSRRRYDEPLGNVTLAGVYFGRARRSSHGGRRLHAERSRLSCSVLV